MNEKILIVDDEKEIADLIKNGKKAEIKPFKNYNYNRPLRTQGYYWLRRDPNNYRLSCTYANRKTGEGGKGCYFPLSDESEYLTPTGTRTSRVAERMKIMPCSSICTRMAPGMMARLKKMCMMAEMLISVSGSRVRIT